MSLVRNRSWFRRLGLAVIAACTLGAAAIPTAPAEAALRVFAGPHGLHFAIVQHRHHDWWRHSYGYYGWHHHGWWYR